MHMHVTIEPHECPAPTRRFDAACRAAKSWFSEQLEIRRTFARLAPGSAFTNRELAALMHVSKGESSKMVSRHPKLLRRKRLGRVVLISMH